MTFETFRKIEPYQQGSMEQKEPLENAASSIGVKLKPEEFGKSRSK